jgi:calicheamicin 4-deoxy-4-thio-alpha-D-digitoxosyltransferase
MAHVVVFTIPAQGHVTPTLAVVEDLVRRGHRVTCLTVEEYAPIVEAAGAEPLRYPTAWSREDSGAEAPAPDPTDVVAWAPLLGLAEVLAQAPVAREHFASSPPDLVLYDAVAYLVGRGLARTWGCPAVRVFTSFASNESFSLFRKLTSGAEPDPQHMAVREFDRLTREFLDEHGHPGVPAAELSERHEELNLVFVPRAFQVAAKMFDDRYVFVGPALGDRAHQGPWHPPASGLPVVLVALGTEEPRPTAAFFRSCVDAFRDEPWHLVLATGQVDPAELGVLPPNVEAHHRVPQLHVLRHAAAFVTHAGMGSMMEALSFRVPLITVPKVPEQAVVAARAAELGLGVFVSDEGVTEEPPPVTEHIEDFGIQAFTPFHDEGGEWLPGAVRRVTSDPGTAERLATLRREIDAAGGAPEAGRAIDALLDRHQRTPDAAETPHHG